MNIQQKLKGREWKLSRVTRKHGWDADLVAKFSLLNQFALAVAAALSPVGCVLSLLVYGTSLSQLD